MATKHKGNPMRAWSVAFVAAAVLCLPGCGYNNLQQQDEAVKAAWSEVVNQYQRRADLIPNLVNTVKGYAAQDQLSSALKSLFAVTENYPQLKSDQNFRDLQSQIEGTENRITVARGRYIEAVQGYNVTVRSFPVNLTAKMFGFQVKPNFTVANEQQIATAPTVSFDTSTPGTPAAAPPAPPADQPKTQGRAGRAAPAAWRDLRCRYCWPRAWQRSLRMQRPRRRDCNLSPGSPRGSPT